MFTPKRVLELVRGVPSVEGEPVRVFWVRVSDESRTEFAARMKAEGSGTEIVPIVIREPLFNSANMVMSDFLRLVESNRSSFEVVVPTGRPDRGLTIVILSKDEFKLPQISSPVVLPAWFPIAALKEVHLRIADLSMESEVGLLNCAEVRIDDVALRLFELERAMVRRLENIARGRPSVVEPMWNQLYDGKELQTSAVDSIAGFGKYLDTVSSGRAYRPSVKTGASLAARLIRVVLKSSPDQLGVFAKVVAHGVGFAEGAAMRPPILAVMLRPSAQLEPAAKTAHAILITVYQAYQLLTGAAHAGDYPVFPVALLYSVSVDIRRALQDATMYVESLS